LGFGGTSAVTSAGKRKRQEESDAGEFTHWIRHIA
jgi:hypothetical protein